MPANSDDSAGIAGRDNVQPSLLPHSWNQFLVIPMMLIVFWQIVSLEMGDGASFGAAVGATALGLLPYGAVLAGGLLLFGLARLRRQRVLKSKFPDAVVALGVWTPESHRTIGPGNHFAITTFVFVVTRSEVSIWGGFGGSKHLKTWSSGDIQEISARSSEKRKQPCLWLSTNDGERELLMLQRPLLPGPMSTTRLLGLATSTRAKLNGDDHSANELASLEKP